MNIQAYDSLIEPNKTQLIIKCICGKNEVLSVTNADFQKYQDGVEHVQNIFPDMSKQDRELLISGTCRKCQKEIFGE